MGRLSDKFKTEVIKLRLEGYSLNEIAVNLDVAKSTVSIITRGLHLGIEARKRLEKRKIEGLRKSLISKKQKQEQENLKLHRLADQVLNSIRLPQGLLKVFCCLMYYCEGVKGADNHLTFVNSDPSLIKLFLSLLRRSFTLDERKFRILMHLHNYHNESHQRQFWSKITGIPEIQFQKSFIKKNNNKRIRVGYQGCISIRYYDVVLVRELLVLYKATAIKLGT